MNQSYDAMRQMLETKGYTVLKGLLTVDEVQGYVDKLEAMSGFRRADYPRTANKKGLSKRGLSTSWYQPDGVTKTPDFWPLIFNEQLLATVRAIVDPDVRATAVVCRDGCSQNGRYPLATSPFCHYDLGG